MVFPVIGKALVKVSVFFLGNVIGVTGPDRLGLVQFLIFDIFGLDLLGLLFVFLVLFIFAFFLLFLHLFFGFLVLDFFLLLFGHGQFDGIADELRVLLHDLLDLLFLDVLGHIFLEMKDDLGASSEFGGFVDGLDSEGAAGGRLPFVPIIVVVLGLDAYAIRHQISGVETHAELTDHRNVSTGLQRLHE